MNKFHIPVLACFAIGAGGQIIAQDNLFQKEQKVFTQQYLPEWFDNYSYRVLYISDGIIYNMNGRPLKNDMKNVCTLSIQPGVASTATLISPKEGSTKNGKTPCKVEIYYEGPTPIATIKDNQKVGILQIQYLPDGKSLALARMDSCLHFHNTQDYVYRAELKTGIQPYLMAFSNNNYYAAISDSSKVEIWNLENRTLRTSLTPSAKVMSLDFSADNAMMALLTSDGCATVYDTRTLQVRYTLNDLGQALACRFHPQNKYLGIVTDPNNITLCNLKDSEDRIVYHNENGHIHQLSFINDENADIEYMIYASGYDIVWQVLGAIKVNLTQQLANMVSLKMNDWVKIREGESMDEYKIRVNDETRLAQQLLFEREIATEMAGNLIDKQNISLGKYNLNSGQLQVNLDQLPSISLKMPREDAASITNADELQFEGTIYGISEDDKYEILYTEALHTRTGKKYVYDNLDRKSVTAMNVETDGYVPLEVIQQSSMEEVKLKAIRDKVTEEAKRENKITDHTHISVNTEVVSDVDASGRSIMNYKIGYNYEVEESFIARDDFGPGKYKAEESNAALSMLKIVQQAFETDFAPYIKDGKQIRIKVTGSADAVPIHGRIKYDGCYGDYEREIIFKDGKMDKMSVSSASGITENEQLAFVRALGVKAYIEKNVSSLNQMKRDYQYHIEVSDKKGGEYRRIGVEFLFIDAFGK